MPKVKKDAVHRHFSFDEETHISNCIHCTAKIKGRHATNLKNHLAVKHKEQYKVVHTLNQNQQSTQKKQNTQNKQNTENVSTVVYKKEDSVVESIKLNCLKLVTIHGRPLELIEDKAFQEILNLATLDNEQAKLINIQSIRSMVVEKACEIKLKISAEVKGRLVCLKLDSVTYLDRTFVGISIQFIKRGVITLRTLATEEVCQSQSKAVLIETLLDVLNDFKIDKSQIYCIITDNGRNFENITQLLDDSYDIQTEDEEDTNSESEEEEDTKLDKNIVPFAELQINNLASFLDDNDDSYKPRTMICIVHTLQLVVQDIIENNQEIQNLLHNVRKVVKMLRKPTLRNLKIKFKKPTLDQPASPSRWSSTYNMLVGLISLKQICLDDASVIKILNDSSWQLISDLVNCLKPIYDTTLKFQKQQLTIGDFFIDWLMCKGHLEHCRTPISQKLLQCMEVREVHLISNNVMLEALYMDVRVNVILSDTEALKARQLLQETFKQINQVANTIESKYGSSSPQASSAPVASISFAEQILRARELRREIEQQCNVNSINMVLQDIRKIPRIASNENILQYWSNSTTESEINELALCVLATPATQVSVEILFSSVRFILSPFNTILSQSNLRDIMVIRNNQDLIE